MEPGRPREHSRGDQPRDRASHVRSFPGLEPAYYGHAGFRRFWEQFRGAWERIWIEVDRIVESGNEIVALFRFHGWGREGIEVQRPFAHLWTIRDGRFARMQAYADQDEALRAIASTGRR
jgi:ketosteroid isomerase-like protein